MGTDALPSLLVASLDLKLVQLLRAAMNGDKPVSGLGPAPNNVERRFHIHPEPTIERRFHIHPEPRIEPREVIRLPDRFESTGPGCDDDVVLVPVPVECYKPCKRAVIEPPWKVLPWEDRPGSCEARPVGPKIKIVVQPPDIAHKGSLIDFFI